MPLTVHADLDIVVDGVEGRLVDDGPALSLQTDRPLAMLRALAQSTSGLPGLSRDLPAPLLDIGPIHLDGPHGRVATLRPQAPPRRLPLPAAITLRPDRLLPPAFRRGVLVGLALLLAQVVRSRRR